jgi:hypothetical protein
LLVLYICLEKSNASWYTLNFSKLNLSKELIILGFFYEPRTTNQSRQRRDGKSFACFIYLF